MTPEAERIAIAEACGWKEVHHGVGRLNNSWEFKSIPDYLSDLNAMHEAENELPTEKRHGEGSYAGWLWKLTAHPVEGGSTWYILHADATQRAEAFLRTLNLWDNSK